MDYYITPEEYKIAEANGITRDALNQRIRVMAWDKNRAMSQPPEPKQKLPKDMVKIAEQNGICYGTFRHRVQQMGWTPERAATEPVMSKEQRRRQAKAAREAGRKYPAEIIELARKNGICYNTFRTRMGMLGWSMSEAATRPLMSPRDKGLAAKPHTEKHWFPSATRRQER